MKGFVKGTLLSILLATVSQSIMANSTVLVLIHVGVCEWCWRVVAFIGV